MKATGIVRRVDDLGRVVIPKEIRRSLLIHEGSPLEIFVEDSSVVFRKYNYVTSVKEALDTLREQVQETEDLKHRADILNMLSELEAMLKKEQARFEGGAADGE